MTRPLPCRRERDVNSLLAQLPGRVWATDVTRCLFEAPIPGRGFPLYMYASSLAGWVFNTCAGQETD